MVAIYIVNSRKGGAVAAAVVRVHEQCVVIGPSVRDRICMFDFKELLERTQICTHAMFGFRRTPVHTHTHTYAIVVDSKCVVRCCCLRCARHDTRKHARTPLITFHKCIYVYIYIRVYICLLTQI